jgi:ADP-ribose pyrophosphatase YjhB (NUDIX family)
MGDMTDVETTGAWLSREELDSARERLPILYVHAVPVRVDDRGVVTRIGLLLRADEDGGIGQEVVGGRVLYHERIRDALARHIENDLGPVALPRIPVSPHPIAVAEFFPTPGVTPYHDPRQHAVSLTYIVAVTGDCRPQQDALDLSWVTPDEAAEMSMHAEMSGSHGVLVRQALAHVGFPV